jgi:hypothetical protein
VAGRAVREQGGACVRDIASAARSYYGMHAGQAVPEVDLTLTCWNQTNARQDVTMTTWRLFFDGSTAYYYPVQRRVAGGCTLQPDQTQDVQLKVTMNAGDHGPYILQTDYTTPQGQPLAWAFNV